MTSNRIVVGAVMRDEWFEPFEISMSALGVSAILLAESLASVSEKSCADCHGVVIELSREVVGGSTTVQWELPGRLAGLPTGPDSESVARSLGISEILSGEEQARAWLQTLAQVSGALVSPLIAVWGTAGAPGATSLAISFAHNLANTHSTLLIDADFSTPSIEQLLGIPGEESGLLGALRIGRNPEPPWESVSGYLHSAGHPSLNVLTGMKPGSLSPMEAGAFPTLIETARSAEVAVVVDVKCSLTPDQTPERIAVDCVLDHADRVFFTGWATNLGVARLVRDWEQIHLHRPVEPSIVALRVPLGQPRQAFDSASEAIWALTGHPDIRWIPENADPLRNAPPPDLTRDVLGFDGTSTTPRTPLARKQSTLIDRLRNPLGRKPLP